MFTVLSLQSTAHRQSQRAEQGSGPEGVQGDGRRARDRVMRFDENSFADTKTFVRQRRGGIGL